jgi:hypothetical protein
MLRMLATSPSGTAHDHGTGVMVSSWSSSCTFGALNSWIPQGRHIPRLILPSFSFFFFYLMEAKLFDYHKIVSRGVQSEVRQDPQKPRLVCVSFEGGDGCQWEILRRISSAG